MLRTTITILILSSVSCDERGQKIGSFSSAREFRKVLFTPDGKSLLTSDKSGDVLLWSPATNPHHKFGKSLTVDDIRRETGKSAVAVSPNGQLFAFVGPKDKIQLWHYDSDKKAALQGLHPGTVTAIAFTNDGKSILSGGDDQNIVVWNVETKTSRALQHGHTKGILAIDVSPVGETFATADEKEIQIWDIKTLTSRLKITRAKAFAADFNSLAFSPDGRTIASTCSGCVKLWDSSNGKELAAIPFRDDPVALAFSPNGKLLAVSNPNAEIMVFDGALSKKITVLDQGVSSAISLAFSPDGFVLASSHSCESIKDQSVSGVVQFWNMKSVNP